MIEAASIISSIAMLLSAVAWPLAVIAIAALLRNQIISLFSRLEKMNIGDNSILFRQEAISSVSEAVEQIAESKGRGVIDEVKSTIDDITLDLIEDNPREATLRQWRRVQRALTNISDYNNVSIDLRSMDRTTQVLKENHLISDELATALIELQKTCKYARRVEEFDLPQSTVEDYVRATNDVIEVLNGIYSR